jgi:hypothetical protein
MSNISEVLNVKVVNLLTMQLPHGPGFRAVRLRLCLVSAFGEFRPQLVYVLLLSLQSLLDSASSDHASGQEGNHPSRLGLSGSGGANPERCQDIGNFVSLRQSGNSLHGLDIGLQERSA